MLVDGEKSIQVFNQTGQIKDEIYIYEIGSITKTFTSSLLAKYISEQKMSLNDSIQKYVEGLDDGKYYPTLKRLVTHTSGYPSHLPLDKEYYDKLLNGLQIKEGTFPFQMDFDKMIHLLRENSLQDKDYPWQYSNFGIALVGYAVGVVSGLGYWDTMNNFLSEELNLKNSYTGTCPNKNLHGFNHQNEDIGNWVWGKDFIAPAGDISSTAEDLLEYARINILEEKPYLALCHQKHVDSNDTDMGLGWGLQKNKNQVLWHNGGTSAFRSYIGIDKQKKCASVVLSNYIINADEIGLGALDSL
jgi:CubicO group peptidase (beta-lactamase class C family)